MFQELLSNVSRTILTNNSSNGAVAVDSIPTLKITQSGKTVESALTDLVLAMRENIEFGKVYRVSVDEGVIGCYVHNKLRPGVGENAAIVVLETPCQKVEELEAFARRLAMHVVAARPLFLTKEDVPVSALEKEKEILSEQMKELEGKPAAVKEKILNGKLGKFYEENCLMDQVYILDDVDGTSSSDKGKRTISEVVRSKGEELGTRIDLKSFIRLKVGESA